MAHAAKGVKHQLTHRTLYADMYLLTIANEAPERVGNLLRIEECDRSNYGVPRLVEQLFRLV